METIIYLIVGWAIGGITIGIFFGLYFRRKTRHLLDEVNKLRGLTFRMLETLEISGLIEWQRDSLGNIKGLGVQSPSKSSKRKGDHYKDDDKNRTIH